MTTNMISSADGWAYALTPNDKLWAARMIAGEGGDPTAVLWTMASRFALLRNTYGTFTSLLRAYSQPINPAWSREGAFCRPGSEAHATAACAESLLARRSRVSALSLAQLVREGAVVERWARGEFLNPVPRAVHFASPGVARSCLRRGACTRVIARSGNWHLSTAESDTWPTHFVSVGGAGDGGRPRRRVGAVCIVTVGGLAWWVWSHRRGPVPTRAAL